MQRVGVLEYSIAHLIKHDEIHFRYILYRSIYSLYVLHYSTVKHEVLIIVLMGQEYTESKLEMDDREVSLGSEEGNDSATR